MKNIKKTENIEHILGNPQNMTYHALFCELDNLLNTHNTVNVAIDGKSGSGKSTLADLISQIYDCNVFHMDDFFLRPELKTEQRLKEVGGNVDYVRFNQEVINKLTSNIEFKYQIYDCKQVALTKFVTVIPKKLNVIEGVYSMHPTLINNYHFKIFLDIDTEIQSERILKRNGSFMHEKFINEWIPKENQYFSEMKIHNQCDIIINV
jgi:uridine kinase